MRVNAFDAMATMTSLWLRRAEGRRTHGQNWYHVLEAAGSGGDLASLVKNVAEPIQDRAEMGGTSRATRAEV